jgi:biopolymer transport protein ExbB
MANAQTKAAPAKKQGSIGVKDAIWIIVACAIIAFVNFNYNLGNASHFAGGTTEGAPLDIFGTIFKGGVIVPVIHTLLLTVIVMSIERVLSLSKCIGKAKLSKFLAVIKKDLKDQNFDQALTDCDKQGGSIANIVRASVLAYKEVDKTTGVKKELKIAKIQQAHEEAIAVEMPTMTMNLPIIATIVTLGTLTGLLGTVIGMIRSFSALAAGGGGDSLELSTGISEALINTAFGIGTSWCAVISYNFFTNRIDKITFALDEIGYSIAQTYAATHAEEA